MDAPLVLFWHRRDLRLTDNVGLAAARQRSSQVVGFFCLDPNILHRDDVAAVRVTYMLGCLQALQQAYLRVGSQLLILQGEPVQAIPKLVNALGAQAVFWNLDGEPYAKERDRLVQLALQHLGIEVNTYWDQLLHEPGKVCTGNGSPYTVYTPFWKNWIQQPKAKPVGDDRPLKGLDDAALEIAQKTGCIHLPTAQALGFSWEGSLILEPGEQPALERLEEFCFQHLTSYQEQRDFPANPGTSGLSPALKFGTIGIRTIWAATLVAWEQSRSQEAQDGIQTWQKELAWREFYQHVLYFFPELAAGPYRPAWRNFPWDNNPEHFQAWCDGRTGYPIVDAAMRQLNETGWMHNRCRMIVASFLTKDLIIDWRWGERYFMQRLIDGDLASNNGGWQWSASSGMDPKPLRIFNPKSQSQKFDPEGEYIRQWLPELRSLETEELVTGKISPLERERCGYPGPIVDHHRQQEIFKQRYQQQKAGIETR